MPMARRDDVGQSHADAIDARCIQIDPKLQRMPAPLIDETNHGGAAVQTQSGHASQSLQQRLFHVEIERHRADRFSQCLGRHAQAVLLIGLELPQVHSGPDNHPPPRFAIAPVV